MKNAIRNLLLAACVMFAASFDVRATGIKNEPRELKPNKGEFNVCTYYNPASEWALLGLGVFTFGTASLTAAFIIYHAREQQEISLLSIIPAEE